MRLRRWLKLICCDIKTLPWLIDKLPTDRRLDQVVLSEGYQRSQPHTGWRTAYPLAVRWHSIHWCSKHSSTVPAPFLSLTEILHFFCTYYTPVWCHCRTVRSSVLTCFQLVPCMRTAIPIVRTVGTHTEARYRRGKRKRRWNWWIVHSPRCLGPVGR